MLTALFALPSAPVFATAVAAPATDKTAFVPACPTTKARQTSKCLNPTSYNGISLTGSVSEIVIGQRVSFSVRGAAPLCTLTPQKTTDPPCSTIQWAVMYGASLAQWGNSFLLSETLAQYNREGCSPASFDCRFTHGILPEIDQAQINVTLPDGAALRMTAIIREFKMVCAGGECSPRLVNGAFLDWPLRARSGAAVTLSGTMQSTQCTAGICRTKGVAGQRLTVSGTTTAGARRSAIATSAADGTWKLRVDKGNYTVTPVTKSFVPETRVVAAARNIGGLDFATCSTSSVARRLVSGGGKGCPDAIGWTMNSRVNDIPRLVAKTANGVLPSKDVNLADGLQVALFLTAQGSRVRSCGTTSWHWAATTKTPGAKVLAIASQGCSTIFKVSRPGVYTVTADEFPQFQAKASRRITQQVTVRDVVILGVGDSNGSGEGVGGFFFPQCNRGAASYQHQAARQIETLSKGHTSVTFVFASCSGAVTSQLGTKTYAGIRPGAALQPQLLQLAKSLRPATGPARKADALMVSTGVNDLSFGAILKFCIQGMPRDAALLLNCEDAPVRVETNAVTGVISAFVFDLTSPLTLREHVGLAVDRLPATYAELNAALTAQPVVGSAHQVLISQYPAFWYEANGAVCGTTPAVSVLTSATWKWLGEQGSKLNTAIAAASTTYKWTLLPVPDKAFWGHGYCTSTSWFVPLEEAFRNGNLPGGFHPTAVGAKVTADVAARKLCALLGPGACR